MRLKVLKWFFLFFSQSIIGHAWCQNINLEKTTRSLSTKGSVKVQSSGIAVIKNCTISASQDVILNGIVKIVNAKIECNVLRLTASSVTVRGTVTIVCNQLDLGNTTHAFESSNLARSKLTVTAGDVVGTGTLNKTKRLMIIITGK